LEVQIGAVSNDSRKQFIELFGLPSNWNLDKVECKPMLLLMQVKEVATNESDGLFRMKESLLENLRVHFLG
jgi:hypothetical protein